MGRQTSGTRGGGGGGGIQQNGIFYKIVSVIAIKKFQSELTTSATKREREREREGGMFTIVYQLVSSVYHNEALTK